MASTSTPATCGSATNAAPAAAPAADPATPSAPSTQRGRPLQREGARHFLSAAEQAMADAMMRSSPPPEPVLGKRARQEDPLDVDTEPDEEPSSTTRPQPSSQCISNINAVTLRYASKKKLRPEQREEVEAFLLVSHSVVSRTLFFDALVRTRRLAGRPSYLFVFCR